MISAEIDLKWILKLNVGFCSFLWPTAIYIGCLVVLAKRFSIKMVLYVVFTRIDSLEYHQNIQ